MSEEYLMHVILGGYSSEKTERLADEKRQIAFKVAAFATKLSIKKAVEKLFKVKVTKVNVLKKPAKVKGGGQQRKGVRSGWKKAYVTLAEGHDIDFVEQKG